MVKRWYIFLLAAMIYMISTPFFPGYLDAYLEDQYPPLMVETLDTSKDYNIIALGGGMGYDDRLPATSLLGPVMMMRMVEGIRVFRCLPHAKLITSGYSRSGRKPQAEVVKEAAALLGVPDSLIFAQGKPSNTIEEAQEYVRVFGKHTPLIISTTATHIPRAVFIFKKSGVQTVIAAPTDYKVKRQNRRSLRHLVPGVGYWGEIQACLHEIFGLWYARWKAF